jgi:hypothetical protein
VRPRKTIIRLSSRIRWSDGRLCVRPMTSGCRTSGSRHTQAAGHQDLVTRKLVHGLPKCAVYHKSHRNHSLYYRSSRSQILSYKIDSLTIMYNATFSISSPTVFEVDSLVNRCTAVVNWQLGHVNEECGYQTKTIDQRSTYVNLIFIKTSKKRLEVPF